MYVYQLTLFGEPECFSAYLTLSGPDAERLRPRLEQHLRLAPFDSIQAQAHLPERELVDRPQPGSLQLVNPLFFSTESPDCEACA